MGGKVDKQEFINYYMKDKPWLKGFADKES